MVNVPARYYVLTDGESSDSPVQAQPQELLAAGTPTSGTIKDAAGGVVSTQEKYFGRSPVVQFVARIFE